MPDPPLYNPPDDSSNGKSLGFGSSSDDVPALPSDTPAVAADPYALNPQSGVPYSPVWNAALGASPSQQQGVTTQNFWTNFLTHPADYYGQQQQGQSWGADPLLENTATPVPPGTKDVPQKASVPGTTDPMNVPQTKNPAWDMRVNPDKTVEPTLPVLQAAFPGMSSMMTAQSDSHPLDSDMDALIKWLSTAVI